LWRVERRRLASYGSRWAMPSVVISGSALLFAMHQPPQAGQKLMNV
jgi:hypothetical protein